MSRASAVPDPFSRGEEPRLAPAAGSLRSAVATNPGLVRERNEDHLLAQQLTWSDGEDVHEAALLVVADGMGGHQAGDRASALVVATLARVLSPVLADLGTAPQELRYSPPRRAPA